LGEGTVLAGDGLALEGASFFAPLLNGSSKSSSKKEVMGRGLRFCVMYILPPEYVSQACLYFTLKKH